MHRSAVPRVVSVAVGLVAVGVLAGCAGGGAATPTAATSTATETVTATPSSSASPTSSASSSSTTSGSSSGTGSTGSGSSGSVAACATASLAVGSEPGSGGVWSVPVEGPGAPVDVAGAVRLTDERWYVGKVVEHAGRAYLMAFRNQGPDGAFVGGIDEPVPLRWRADGRGLAAEGRITP